MEIKPNIHVKEVIKSAKTGSLPYFFVNGGIPPNILGLGPGDYVDYEHYATQLHYAECYELPNFLLNQNNALHKVAVLGHESHCVIPEKLVLDGFKWNLSCGVGGSLVIATVDREILERWYDIRNAYI